MKRLILAVALVGLVGCARVTVRKVPTPTQYTFNGASAWTQEMQQRADRMEGLRFYLPRPFVTVFESFPIATDLYLAKGRVSADNRYVVIETIIPVTTRGDVANGGVTTLTGTSVPKSLVFRRTASTAAADLARLPASPRSATDEGELSRLVEEARRAAETAGGAAAEAKVAAADAGSVGAGEATRTGTSRRRVTNNNGAFAFTPLRGNFDILYLPDFEEQYVVSSKAHLGNASFELNLGQGWSLQGFNSLTDNSELNKRIFNLIDTASELAKQAATAGLGSVLPTAGLGMLADSLATPRSGDEMEESAGTPVALKIVVVHYAAKGLYPVIKPRELAGQTAPGLVIDLLQRGDDGRVKLPSPEEIKASVERLDLHQRRFTVPVYPYQYVSFNTFRYLAIQVLKPDGLPLGDLYDRTGTMGDAGDRQAFDMAEVMRKLFGALGGPAAPADEGQPVDGDDAALIATLQGLEASALAEVRKTVPEAQDIKLSLGNRSAEKRVIKAQVTYPPDTAAPTDQQRTAMEAAVRALLNANTKLKGLLGGEVTNVAMSTPVP